MTVRRRATPKPDGLKVAGGRKMDVGFYPLIVIQMAICFILAILVLVSFPALGPWAISVFWNLLVAALIFTIMILITVLVILLA
jgi:hypothetical protein